MGLNDVGMLYLPRQASGLKHERMRLVFLTPRWDYSRIGATRVMDLVCLCGKDARAGANSSPPLRRHSSTAPRQTTAEAPVADGPQIC